jgi:predicted transglutaminase-like cysteine proteinase
MRKAELRYGNLGPVAVRLLEWRDLLGSDLRMPELEKLRMVNLYFNRRLRFSDDSRIWGQRDYWATPVEALVKGAADCEDYALAKYFSLRQLGVPASKLRITYVKALRLNQAHMVLTYYPSPKAAPLVLDNLINEIRPAWERNDLLPVYAFNAEGVYLVKQQGLERTSDAKRLSRWQDLLRKMQGEGFSF